MQVLIVILAILLTISIVINVVMYFYITNLLIDTQENRESMMELLEEQLVLLDSIRRMNLDSHPSYTTILEGCKELYQKNKYYIETLRRDLGMAEYEEKEGG